MSRTDSRSRFLLGLVLLALAPACAATARSGVPSLDQVTRSSASAVARGHAPQSYVYVANYFGDRGVDVYRADVSGPRILRTIRTGVSKPGSIWVDASGKLYVANDGANDVTIYASGASKPELVLRDGLHLPDAVTT